MEPNSRLLEYLQKNASYTYTDQESSTPEWSLYYGLVGGKSDPTQRYPYNSVYVTTDLLLHTYHKLFSNSLKYYEMKTARSQVADIAQESMQHFAQLAKKASSDARAYYDYLTAYWSVAHIFLPSEEEYKTRYDALQQQYWNSRGEQSQDFEDNDFTDHYLHQWIRERLEWTLKEYPTQYNDAVEKLVEEILAGKEERGRDHLAHAFSPQTDPKFVIVQDYTMFVPRGHYADNTLLKTYFFAMKWLMRHKMYARDPHMAKASLLLASHLPEKSSSQLKHLQTFVKTMIGADDDVTLEDLQKFLTTRSLKTPQAILNASTDGRAQDIAALRPQKIISTPYETVENSQVSEQEAKEMTAGFVFFGEKFAVDSWIADQLTAGPSEQESEYKPPVVSVYQLFDTLLTTDHWKSYAQHWLSSVQKQFKLTDTHLSSYPQVRDETKQEMSGVLEHDPKTLYTKRLEVMETTTVVPDRAPIYMRGVNYLKKIFNTMLGTYTELKHDTILYVKQAFAELGAGGGAECDVLVEYDELPVPK